MVFAPGPGTAKRPRFPAAFRCDQHAVALDLEPVGPAGERGGLEGQRRAGFRTGCGRGSDAGPGDRFVHIVGRPVAAQVSCQVQAVVVGALAVGGEEPHRGRKVEGDTGPDVIPAAAAGMSLADTRSVQPPQGGARQGGADPPALMTGSDQHQRDAPGQVHSGKADRALAVNGDEALAEHRDGPRRQRPPRVQGSPPQRLHCPAVSRKIERPQPQTRATHPSCHRAAASTRARPRDPLRP
jgi:hypothetical protein